MTKNEERNDIEKGLLKNKKQNKKSKNMTDPFLLKETMTHPLQTWQVPEECAKCHDSIYSRYQGEFVTCKCGSISVDQTKYYVRHIGNLEDFVKKNDQ